VGVLSFARYAVESVLRSKRRSIQAVAGVAIAISLFSGSVIAIDSSVSSIVSDAISSIAVDFSGECSVSAYPVDPSRHLSALEDFRSLEEVEYATTSVTLHSWTYVNDTGKSYSGPLPWMTYGTIILLGGDCDRLLDAYGIEGLMPSAGTVAISQDLADTLGVEIGDALTCSQVFTTIEYVNATPIEISNFVNLTFQVSQIWSQDEGGRFHEEHYGWQVPGAIMIDGAGSSSYWNPVVLNLADANLVNSIQFNVNYNVDYYVWIDRSAVIDPAQISQTLDRLDFVFNRLQRIGSEHSARFGSDQLAYNMNQVERELNNKRMLYLSLSLPILALGGYLSVVGVDLGVASRRREIAILKSRGASDEQVFSAMLVESVLLGAIAGMIGLAAGLLLSRFLLHSAGSVHIGGGTSPSIDQFGISPLSIAMVLGFGIAVMAASAYLPLKKASRVPVSHALHYYLPSESAVTYRPRIDIVFLLLVSLSILSVAFASEESYRIGRSFVIGSVAQLILDFGVVLVPVVPLLLSVSVIRLLVKGRRKLYGKITRLFRPWLRELNYIVNKNIVRNPRRASNVCIVVSLALAFGIFLSAAAESAISHERMIIEHDVGADVHVRGEAVWNGTGYDMDPSVLNSLEEVDGVDRVTTYHEIMVGSSNQFITVMAMIDAQEYASVVRPDDFYFVGGDSSMLLELRGNGSILVNDEFADEKAILVGDVLNVDLMSIWYSGWFQQSVSLKVVGVVKSLPGLGDQLLFGDVGSFDFLPDVAFLESFGVFAEVESGYNHEEVADNLESYLDSGGASTKARVLESALAELNDDPSYGALQEFLYMEYALSIVMMSTGVGLIVFATVSERERELACIMARGSSGGQIRKILMGESLSLMLLGIGMGAAVGFLSAALFANLISKQLSTAVPYPLELGIPTWTILAVSVISFLLASLLATVWAGRMRLAEVLRIRGG